MSEIYQPDDLIGCRQAAELANCHPRTIAAWIKRGWLAAIKRPGIRGRYLIRYADLTEVINRRYESAEDQRE